MKSSPCQPVARKSFSTLLSIAYASTIGLVGFGALPIDLAIAEPSALPSTEQQRPIHQKLRGTWELMSPAISIDKSESGKMIFQSATELTEVNYRSKNLIDVVKAKYQILSIRNVNSSQLITLKITSLESSDESSKIFLLQFQGDRQLKIENIDQRHNAQEFAKAIILGQKIGNGINVPVLNEAESVAIPESTPDSVPSPEQAAIIHRRLAGTWIRPLMKDEYESNNGIQYGLIFRPEKEIEGVIYRKGKLLSRKKSTYRIVAIHRTGPSQLITIEYTEPSSQGKKDDLTLMLVEFKNDRQLKVGLAKKNSTIPSFGTDATHVDKINDSTDAPDRIPFKASLVVAENEALKNVSIILRAQSIYKEKKGQYAANIDQLEIDSDLFDQKDSNQLYSYRTTKIGTDRVTVMAIPKNKQLRGYIGLNYPFRFDGVGIVDLPTLCKSDRPSRKKLDNPIMVVKGFNRFVIQCPRGSHRVMTY
jgi:hypothetical protein